MLSMRHDFSFIVDKLVRIIGIIASLRIVPSHVPYKRTVFSLLYSIIGMKIHTNWLIKEQLSQEWPFDRKMEISKRANPLIKKEAVQRI